MPTCGGRRRRVAAAMRFAKVLRPWNGVVDNAAAAAGGGGGGAAGAGGDGGAGDGAGGAGGMVVATNGRVGEVEEEACVERRETETWSSSWSMVVAGDKSVDFINYAA